MSINNIDICCVTETWLHSNIPTEAVDIDGYVLHRHDRSDGRQCGGVAAYVRNSVSCVRLLELELQNVETLWLLFRSQRMPRTVSHILIGVVYHPPDADNKTTTDHLVDAVDIIMKRHPNAGVIILGDVNHLQDKPLREYPLKQLVTSATRGEALLDKIYSNISEWYLTPTILPITAGSDHRTVLVTPVQHNVKPGNRVAVVVRSNDPNGKNALARALDSINWLPLYRMTSVEEMTSFFYSTVMSLLDKYLPERVVIRHTSNKPWVTDEFCRLIRQRQHAWTSNNMVEYRRLRNRVARLSCSLRRRFCQKRIEGLRRCNSSNWWRETKRLTGQADKSDLTGLANSECEGDMQLLADVVNGSLQEVSADLQPLMINNFATCDTVPSQYTIFPEEVYNKLSRINTHKAPGPDGLPNWFLKEFAFTLSDPICSIFNTSVQQGIVPTLWKSANVVPIPKVKPARSIQNDLRPISLTPTLSKLLESFVGEWMLETVSSKFDAKQFGGLKGRSTIHALVDILHLWHTALNDERSIRVVFIDYAKAFDHVDHPTVLRKMVGMGIPDFIVQWMFSFLSDRQQRVKIGSNISQWLNLKGGMPQGTWLGLYIFLILINDLAAPVELHKYVDDVTLSEMLAKQEPSSMQSVMNDVIKWSTTNLMKINERKTKEMLVGTLNRNPPPTLYIDSQPIERVSAFKLLGITISDSLSWEENVSNICSKAGKRLHFLKLLKRSGVSTEDLLYYYCSVVRPVLEYGCVVWQSSITEEQKHRLDSIQRRAERIIGPSEASGKLTPLTDRRNDLARRFFQSLQQPTSCLHNILPHERDSQVIGKLRHANTLTIPFARTERYKNSFLINALANYQT